MFCVNLVKQGRVLCIGYSKIDIFTKTENELFVHDHYNNTMSIVSKHIFHLNKFIIKLSTWYACLFYKITTVMYTTLVLIKSKTDWVNLLPEREKEIYVVVCWGNMGKVTESEGANE